MLRSQKSFKKTMFLMLLTFVFALAMAVPASAAAQNLQFLDENGAYSTHASAFIDSADVTGSAGNYTVTIKLKNTYPPFPTIPVSYGFLNVDVNGAPAGDGTYEVSATKSVSGGFTYFVFSGVNNLTDNLPVELQVNAGGFHNTTYSLFIDWL
ncbi:MULTISPECIES: hypothetical protein [Bacillales]|uniref:hypothetical protein n=1 Tax=Bacillales TaxID=1385 RepID=UPI0006A797E5|nr:MULTISPECIES: hypothetical protein [Bacillales]OBZ11028.1 hypothetical protein A7975_18780 [Bacillus sp. FJAT-26390]